MQTYTRIVNAAGALIAFWDDSTRMFTAWDDSGAIIEGPRAYTPQENSDADVRIATAAAEAARVAQLAAVRLIITDLKTEKDRVQPVIDLLNSATVTTSQIKDIAKASKRIADAAIDLAKLLAP